MQLSAKEAWKRILEEAHRELPEHTVRTWLEPAEAIALDDGRLIVGAPDHFGHAVLQVVLEQPAADTPKRLLHRGELHQHVGAVALLLHHLLQAADLPLDPAQPSSDGMFDFRVYAIAVSPVFSLGATGARELRLGCHTTLVDCVMREVQVRGLAA